MNFFFVLSLLLGLLSYNDLRATGSSEVEEVKDIKPPVGRLENRSVRTTNFLFRLSQKVPSKTLSSTILSYVPFFLPNFNTIPCISTLATTDLGSLTSVFRPWHKDIPVEKTRYRYNIAFKSARVPKDILSTDIPELRRYVQGFTPDQWTNSDSKPWHDSEGACYRSYLMIPPVTNSIKGGIIWLHGSNGPTHSTISKCRHFVDKGYVVLLPNLFSPFGATSTANDQLKIPLENSILAAYRALHLLKSSPKLKDKPIALMGESRGGIITDLCARHFYQIHISPGVTFDRFIVIDGFPLFSGPVDYANSFILMLHGRLDRWTELKNTQQHFERYMKPTQSRLITFSCGHGVLDNKSFREWVPTFNRCSLEDKGSEGFLPLMLKGQTMHLYQGNWSLGMLFPWGRVPSFIRKFFNVVTFKPDQNIPWRHFEQFLKQYSEMRYLWPAAYDPSIKDNALKEVESFLEEGRVII